MGKFDTYKIDLKGMRADLVTYEFALDNLYFSHIDAPEIQKGRVHVVLTVKRTAHAFDFNFQIEGSVCVPCDRCLDEMDLSVTANDKLVVKFGTAYAEEGDNLIVIPEEEGAINVAWFIYEFIVLAIPMKHVHPLGKCDKSMATQLSKHLRTEADDESEAAYESEAVVVEEEDADRPIDPRWNELKKILDNN